MGRRNNFEAVYVKSSKQLISAVTLVKMKGKSRAEYYKLKNNLFCPECRQTLLVVVNRAHSKYIQRSHIKSNPMHENCSYGYRIATQRETQKFIKSSSNQGLREILNALLTKLDLIHRTDNQDARLFKEINCKLLYTLLNNKSFIQKRIPQQGLDELLIHNVQPGAFKFYYGRVVITSRQESIKKRIINYKLCSKEGIYLASLSVPISFSKLTTSFDAIFTDHRTPVIDLAIFTKITINEFYMENGHRIVYRNLFLDQERDYNFKVIVDSVY